MKHIGSTFNTNGQRTDLMCDGKHHWWRRKIDGCKRIAEWKADDCDCKTFVEKIAAMFGVKL